MYLYTLVLEKGRKGPIRNPIFKCYEIRRVFYYQILTHELVLFNKCCILYQVKSYIFVYFSGSRLRKRPFPDSVYRNPTIQTIQAKSYDQSYLILLKTRYNVMWEVSPMKVSSELHLKVCINLVRGGGGC